MVDQLLTRIMFFLLEQLSILNSDNDNDLKTEIKVFKIIKH